jgi:hypothetical protein
MGASLKTLAGENSQELVRPASFCSPGENWGGATWRVEGRGSSGFLWDTKPVKMPKLPPWWVKEAKEAYW